MRKALKAIFQEITGVFSTNQLISRRRKTHQSFAKNIDWIKSHTIDRRGISVTSRIRTLYPEVSGYYIDSLYDWGERDLGNSFAENLLKIQDPTGGFLDPSGKSLCVFDTGQVIRGLLRVRNSENEAKIDSALIKSITWIGSLIEKDGRIRIPEEAIWGGVVPRAIVLYALEPAQRAAELLQDSNSKEKFKSAVEFTIRNEELNFASLNHFHAYIAEALFDLGYIDLCQYQMDNVKKLISPTGKLPAKPNSKWACSTAQFQYAKVFYKLGDLITGDLLFNFGKNHQNRNGGWFGTIGFLGQVTSPLSRLSASFSRYFPFDEISWANKYFMDALNQRMVLSFRNLSTTFSDHIDSEDGRLKLIKKEIDEFKPMRILDLGCGKGRYITQLVSEFTASEFIAVDISKEVMNSISKKVDCRVGSLTDIPAPDNSIDFIFAIESLEHAIHVPGALLEIKRVLRPGGRVLIIDKNKFSLRRFTLPDWEQWFNPKSLGYDMEKLGFDVTIIRNIPYEGRQDRLFAAWRGQKK
jgi:malonyl-CoA O-methyltransferase